MAIFLIGLLLLCYIDAFGESNNIDTSNAIPNSVNTSDSIPNRFYDDIRYIESEQIDEELSKPFLHEGGSPPLGASFYDLSEYMIGKLLRINFFNVAFYC